jgi:hypothetical protein
MNLPKDERDPLSLKEITNMVAYTTKLADGEEVDQSPIEISTDLTAYTA